MAIEFGKFIQNRSASRETRSAKRSKNILGVKQPDAKASGTFRKQSLETVDKYLKSMQYKDLAAWDSRDHNGDPLPMRQRAPKIVYNLAKRISDTLASKLLGPRVFPVIKLDQDPITKELFDHITKITNLKSRSMDMARFLGSHGSCFMRFKFKNGKLMVERYNPNTCYPEFGDDDDLVSIDIKYIYIDSEDLDPKGKPKRKWFKMSLSKTTDILYDNPEHSEDGSDPEFQVVKTAKHDLGFVQGEWFKIGDDNHDPDGPSLVHETLGFIDAFNYSLSQSDQAVAYNQEPQLLIKGMDNDEMDNLIKSSMSSWSLGRDGDASYLETSLGGVERASDLRDKYKENIGDITRVILLDPEKIVGSAQSGKAMEILHGPLLDLIDEYRPYAERGLIRILQKMVASVLILNEQGIEMVGITIPKGYSPTSLDISFTWPSVFPMTMQDLQQKVSVATQAASASIVSRETMTAWLAKDFGIENLEEEKAKIDAQPVINPFGF